MFTSTSWCRPIGAAMVDAEDKVGVVGDLVLSLDPNFGDTCAVVVNTVRKEAD